MPESLHPFWPRPTSPRRRAHRIATDYARRVEAFGSVLDGHESVGFMADNETDIRAAPARHLHSAWAQDQANEAAPGPRSPTWRVADRCV